MDDTTAWYGPDMATFGDRLAAARERAGLTQAELSRRLGVRATSLRAWEDDRSEPRANQLSTLAGLLNVSMAWLMTGQGVGPEAPADALPLPASAREILGELRALRADMVARAEQLGRLERKLRTALQEFPDDRDA